MKRIDAYASRWHYLDHIAPIWRALPDEYRGDVLIEKPQLRAHPLVAEAEGRLRQKVKPHTISRVLVASSADAKIAARYRWGTALLEHGAGQLYQGGKPSSSGPGGPQRTTVGLFLCTNEAVAAANAAAYGAHRCVVVGSPRLEDLALARSLHVPSEPPVLALTWHWACRVAPPWSETLLFAAENALSLLAERWRGPIIGTSHPRIWLAARNRYEAAGIEPVQSWPEVIRRADVLSFDNTSAGFEAAALGIPVVLLESPLWDRGTRHGLRFWEWAGIGSSVRTDGSSEDLAARWVDGVVEALTHRDRYAPVAAAMTEEVYPHREDSTERAVAALLRWVGSAA